MDSILEYSFFTPFFKKNVGGISLITVWLSSVSHRVLRIGFVVHRLYFSFHFFRVGVKALCNHTNEDGSVLQNVLAINSILALIPTLSNIYCVHLYFQLLSFLCQSIFDSLLVNQFSFLVLRYLHNERY